MAANATMRRRVLGALVLGTAILLVVLGETILKNRLSPVGYVFYWMLCLVLTGGAIVIAILDVQALRQRTQAEHKQILESTFNEIQRKARDRQRLN